MKRFAVLPLAVVLASAACQVDAPTAPPAVRESPKSPPSESVSDFASAADDAVARILPALDDPGVAAQLGPMLSALSLNLQAGRLPQAQAQLTAARAVLDRAGDLKDGGTIDLVLVRAGQIISGDAE
ncbi:MAG TPA: hypothetical protein VGR37_20765 [Longimicrobiaceae bacterium]|nr:hypothetical protein [Longimicrobiaceae bacterium]